MALQTMYPAKNNSPATALADSITASATSMTLYDASVLPAAPNICVIGNDDTAEIVSYTGISGNTVTGLGRGVNGTIAKVWAVDTHVARNITAYDHEAFRANITALDNSKQDTLTFDSTPTADSANPVTSGGIKTALDMKKDAFSVLLIEDGGTGQSSLDDIKDAFGLWYKPGDIIGIGSGQASYAGFLAGAKIARFIITLDKPVKPETAIAITGTVAVRVGSSRTDIALSNTAGTATASGIRVDATASTSMGSQNEPCAVGSVGLTITFS